VFGGAKRDKEKRRERKNNEQNDTKAGETKHGGKGREGIETCNLGPLNSLGFWIFSCF